MEDVWLPVTLLKVKARMTDNDQAPMQSIMDWDQKKILTEDVHTLHQPTYFSQLICQLQNIGPARPMQHAKSAVCAHLCPRLDPEVVALSRCERLASIAVWCALSPYTLTSTQTTQTHEGCLLYVLGLHSEGLKPASTECQPKLKVTDLTSL